MRANSAMDPKSLAEFGLTEAEARVYLALLQTGKAKSGAIIKATSLQSSTVYNALPALVQKGVVSYVHAGKMKYFSAEPPESLQLFLEEKKRRLSEMLPDLKKLEAQGVREQKSARVFEGFKGLSSAFNDVYLTMKKGEEYCFFQMAADALAEKQVSFFFRKWHLRRSNAGILAKGLAVERTRKPMEYIFKGLPHTELRFVDDFMPTGMVVYKNKVMLLDFAGTPTAFQIQSQSIADSFRRVFNAKWKTARE